VKIGQVIQNAIQVAHNLRGEFGAGEPNLLAGTPGAPDVLAPRADSERADGWVNEKAGFGTSRDKTQGAYWQAPYGLTDPELTDLYNFHDLAAKVVDIPVREAFRSGFCFTGIDPEKLGYVEDYLRNYNLLQHSKAACTWGRLYGGAAKYMKTPGSNPATPMTPGETIEAIHVIDRRHLWPFRWYTQGPKAATPETYNVAVMGGGGQMVLIGEVHESRLVTWPGAMTEMQEKRRRQGWDLSVVQRPYEALSDSGTVWKAIQVLTVDANQAVFKIKNFWRMIAGDPSQGQDSLTGTGPSGGILKRIQFMDLMRSVSRAIVMDLDDEDFERKPTSFAGLPELSERQWVRVSAASDIPLPLLTGEYPSGLQSTGEGPFRVFYAYVQSLREQEYSPRVIQAARLLLQQRDCPVKLSDEELRKLQVKWNPIWSPTEAELADIKTKTVTFGAGLVEMQAITAEEFVLGLPEEWLPAVNREALEQRLKDLQAAPVEENAAARLQFAPTDLASFVSVNAALTSVGLEPLGGTEGEMTVAAFRAKGEADAAPPAPAPSGFKPGGKFDSARTDSYLSADQWTVCEAIWGTRGRTDSIWAVGGA
jgi:phage-related protein (TIGR01555 family)